MGLKVRSSLASRNKTCPSVCDFFRILFNDESEFLKRKIEENFYFFFSFCVYLFLLFCLYLLLVSSITQFLMFCFNFLLGFSAALLFIHVWSFIFKFLAKILY